MQVSKPMEIINNINNKINVEILNYSKCFYKHYFAFYIKCNFLLIYIKESIAS